MYLQSRITRITRITEKARREETLASAHRCSIINETRQLVAEDASQSCYEVRFIM